MTSLPTSEYMKIAEAARFLGVTQRWVYRRVLSGELPASKVGGLYFIQRKDLQALLDGGRVAPSPEDKLESASPLPRLKCGFCYRLLADESEVGGMCSSAGCGELICDKCWQLHIHTCVRHSPTRAERLQSAREGKQSGVVSLLVEAPEARLSEINFLNRIHARLGGYSTLIHPLSGEALDIPSWDAVLETGDERAELMHLLGKVALDADTTSQIPLNAWHHYTLKPKARKASTLELYVQVAANMEKMVRDGFDTLPLTLADLNAWIEKLIEQPARSGNFRLVLLASATGWEPRVLEALSGAVPFSHRLALLYLFDLGSNTLLFNNADAAARRYAELFRPMLPDEETAQVIHVIIDLMGAHDSLRLEDACSSLPYPAEKVNQAFNAMAAGGDYILTEIKGLGTTLVRRQAL